MRRFHDFLIASNLPMAVSAILGGIVSITILLGWQSAIAGIGMMLSICIFNVHVANTIGKRESTNLKAADGRLNILSEILHVIKAVKFFAW